jgi:hypothetical protein
VRPPRAKGASARTEGRIVVGGNREEGGLRRLRLRSNRPPDDADQIDDRELEDEHQKDDLDHRRIVGALAPGVADLEREHIGPVVVADGVEALALLEQSAAIELGVEDPFLVVERPGEVGAVRPENRTAATAQDVGAVELVAEWKVVGVRRGSLEVARADHEGA